VYFNINFNVFFKLIKVLLLVSEIYMHQNGRCNDKKIHGGTFANMLPVADYLLSIIGKRISNIEN